LESHCLNWLAQREREGGGGGRVQRGLRRHWVGLSSGEGEERKGEKGRLTSRTQPSAFAGITEKEEEGDVPLREGIDGPPG
jgi:hypothetical protein